MLSSPKDKMDKDFIQKNCLKLIKVTSTFCIKHIASKTVMIAFRYKPGALGDFESKIKF